MDKFKNRSSFSSNHSQTAEHGLQRTGTNAEDQPLQSQRTMTINPHQFQRLPDSKLGTILIRSGDIDGAELNDNASVLDHEHVKKKEAALLQILEPINHFFDFGLYFKFVIYHIIYFMVLGPFIIILAPCIGYSALKNMLFIDLSPVSILQITQWLLILFTIISLSALDTGVVSKYEMAMVFVPILTRMLILGAKYGYSPPRYVKRLLSETITPKELEREWLLFKWRVQNEEIVDEEFQAAILRNHVNLTSFYLNFLNPTSPELEAMLKPKQVQQSEAEATTEDQLEKLKIQTFSFRPYVQKLFWSFASKHSRLEKTHYFAYYLGFDLLKRSKPFRNGYVFLFAMLVSIARALMPIILRLASDVPAIGTNGYQTSLVFSIFFINNLLYFLNLLTIWLSICDLRMKKAMMNQMSYLITEQVIDKNYPKFYPPINVFDANSLKSWMDLRKSLLDYGRKFLVRNSANITVFFAIYIPILLFVIFELVGITNFLANERLTLVIFSYESCVSTLTFFIFLFLGAQLNDFFLAHRTLLKRNKDIVADLLYYPEDFSDPRTMSSPNIKIYLDALEAIARKVEDKHERKEYVRDKFTELLGIYETLIEDLVFDEANNSFKILGFTANWQFIKQIATAFISAGVLIFKERYAP